MKRSLFGAMALAVVAVTAVLIGTASAAKAPSAPSNNTCPTNPKNLPTANNVGASWSDVGNLRTYTFQSFTNQTQTAPGVPGLVNYCVYTDQTANALVPLAHGADGNPGTLWQASKASAKNFSFSRPGGDKTNIRLDGTSTDVGTATFGTLPAAGAAHQTIVLHIADASKCGSSPTCFVLPGTAPTGTLTVKKLVINNNGGTKIATDFKFKVNSDPAASFVLDPAFPNDSLHGKNTVTVPSGAFSVVEDGLPIAGYGTTYSATGCSGTMAAGGTAECTITNDDLAPVCNAADTSLDAEIVAYNNIPKDAIHCGPPSHAFEATETREFGDEVTLEFPGRLESLSVLFNSYGCADAPLWNNGQCATLDPNATFQHEITVNVYAASVLGEPGSLLATATETKTFPFRPSANQAVCGDNGGDPARWFNPVSGTCTYSKKVVHEFTDWTLNGQPVVANLSGNVVWTVAYNTTHHGYNPIGEVPAVGPVCWGVDGGCGYDSLNVGVMTFANSAYAGEYVDLYGAFINSTWNGIYCDNGPTTGTLRESTNSVSPCANFGPPPADADHPSNPNYEKDAWLGYQPLGMIVVDPT